MVRTLWRLVKGTASTLLRFVNISQYYHNLLLQSLHHHNILHQSHPHHLPNQLHLKSFYINMDGINMLL